jgi:nucleotide-binding universal stress UspA family protein
MHIVHAIKRIDMTRTVLMLSFSSKAAVAEEELYATLKKEASRWIEQYERKARGAGISDVIAKILADGTRSEVQMITEYADTVKADIIVMGSRGLGSFKRLLLGSVAGGVVSHASCPVYLAR